MARLHLSNADSTAVLRALGLLRAYAPEHFAHFSREVTDVYYHPTVCGPGAVACTGGPLERRVVLTTRPAEQSLLELTLSLAHEAMHHQRDTYGRPYEFAHKCRDGGCSDPVERARDPIYAEEERLRLRLSVAMSIAAASQPVSPRVSPLASAFAAGAAAAIGLFGIKVIADAIAASR